MGLHTRTVVARLPLRQLGFLVIIIVVVVVVVVPGRSLRRRFLQVDGDMRTGRAPEASVPMWRRLQW